MYISSVVDLRNKIDEVEEKINEVFKKVCTERYACDKTNF